MLVELVHVKGVIVAANKMAYDAENQAQPELFGRNESREVRTGCIVRKQVEARIQGARGRV